MDPQKVFDIYDKMFATEAWKDLVIDFQQRLNDLGQQILRAADEKELYRAQGQALIFNYVINLENTMESAKKHVADGSDE